MNMQFTLDNITFNDYEHITSGSLILDTNEAEFNFNKHKLKLRLRFINDNQYNAGLINLKSTENNDIINSELTCYNFNINNIFPQTTINPIEIATCTDDKNQELKLYMGFSIQNINSIRLLNFTFSTKQKINK
jgi:hypothetical protein